MKDQRKTELKVGLTVLVGLVVIIFGFSWFKGWGVGDGGGMIRMRFTTSSGVQAGDLVTLNGVKAGQVSSVRLVADGVLVDASLLDGMTVSADAHPTIQMLELMGGKKIDISQGSSSALADTTVILEGTVDPDIAGALSFMGELEGDIRGLQQRADTLLRNLNAIVGDRELLSSIKQTAGNLQAVSRDTRAFLQNNSGNLDRLAQDLGHLVTTADTLLTEMKPGLQRGVDRAGTLFDNADTLLVSLREVVDEMRQSRGMLHTVMHDTTLVQRLDKSLLKLDTLTDILIRGELKIEASLF